MVFLRVCVCTCIYDRFANTNGALALKQRVTDFLAGQMLQMERAEERLESTPDPTWKQFSSAQPHTPRNRWHRGGRCIYRKVI